MEYRYHKVSISLYDPKVRGREKAAQRLQDALEVAAGKLADVEARNYLVTFNKDKPVVSWETTPLLK